MGSLDLKNDISNINFDHLLNNFDDLLDNFSGKLKSYEQSKLYSSDHLSNICCYAIKFFPNTEYVLETIVKIYKQIIKNCYHGYPTLIKDCFDLMNMEMKKIFIIKSLNHNIKLEKFQEIIFENYTTDSEFLQWYINIFIEKCDVCHSCILLDLMSECIFISKPLLVKIIKKYNFNELSIEYYPSFGTPSILQALVGSRKPALYYNIFLDMYEDEDKILFQKVKVRKLYTERIDKIFKFMLETKNTKLHARVLNLLFKYKRNKKYISWSKNYSQTKFNQLFYSMGRFGMQKLYNEYKFLNHSSTKFFNLGMTYVEKNDAKYNKNYTFILIKNHFIEKNMQDVFKSHFIQYIDFKDKVQTCIYNNEF